MRTAIYVRVSTGRQVAEGLSLAEQERRAREYVERQGWALGAVFVEAGLSGRRDDRPELLAMLARLSEFDVIVIPKLDRLGRSASHLWRIYGELEAADVELVSLADGFDTTTAAGKLMRSILSAVAELESDTISERVRAVTEARARRGLHNGGPPPYGYGYDASGRLAPHATEAAVVRRIFADFNAGVSQRAITRNLNREGERARKGAWYQGTISQTLRNPVYVGRVRLNGREFPGQHDPIISAEEWDRTQNLRKATHGAGGARGRRTAGAHLFHRGHLRCGRCGGSMIPRSYRRRDGSRYEVYLCYTRVRDNEACAQTPVARPAIDSAVMEYFERVGLDLDATRQQIEAGITRRMASASAVARAAERQVALKEAELARVERDYLAGDLSAKAYERLSRQLEMETTASCAERDRLVARENEDRLTEARIVGEGEIVEQLTRLRAAVAGKVTDGETLAAVRAALLRLFESFTLRHVSSEGAPGCRVEAALEFGEFHEGLGYEYWLEPLIRPEAVVGFRALEEVDAETGMLVASNFATPVDPVLRRESLSPAICSSSLDNDGDGWERKSSAPPDSACTRSTESDSGRPITITGTSRSHERPGSPSRSRRHTSAAGWSGRSARSSTRSGRSLSASSSASHPSATPSTWNPSLERWRSSTPRAGASGSASRRAFDMTRP